MWKKYNYREICMEDDNQLLNIYFSKIEEKEDLNAELNKLKLYRSKLMKYLNFKEQQLLNTERKILEQFISIKRYRIKIYIIENTISFLHEQIIETNKKMAAINKRIRCTNTHIENIRKYAEIILKNKKELVKRIK